MTDTIFNHKQENRSSNNGQSRDIRSIVQTIIVSVTSVILAWVLMGISSTLGDIKTNTAVMATKIDYVVLSVQENRIRIESLENK